MRDRGVLTLLMQQFRKSQKDKFLDFQQIVNLVFLKAFIYEAKTNWIQKKLRDPSNR